MTESSTAAFQPDGRFIGLVREFAARAGFPATEIEQADGIEFESEGFATRLCSHPTDHMLLVAEVDVLEIDPSNARHLEAAWLLHQINHAARFEHRWIAHIDETNVLMMTCQLDMTGMGPESIEELLADGISRAEALASLWQASGQEQQDSAPVASPPGLIRG
ncbi:MAG: hypothetical protein RLZZ153_2192 [Pseudomonadota bacterium]|jgi:hypothetical protein